MRTLVLRVWCGQAPRFEPVRPEGDRWVLGRDTVDGDSRMSRRHCEVFLQQGRAFIRDMGSSNGTWVNGAPVGRDPVELVRGAARCLPRLSPG